MGRIVVINHLTLDGVMQAPGRPDEDTRGGFAHGGWARSPTTADRAGQLIGGHMRASPTCCSAAAPTRTSTVLAGRSDNPFSRALDAGRKYVVSRTLGRAAAMGELACCSARRAASRRGPTATLVILGSGELIRSLLAENLVDELLLLVHPIVLGAGRRMFAADGPHASCGSWTPRRPARAS